MTESDHRHDHDKCLSLQKFFKEKATNTQELLRQHVQLQGDAEKKDKELSQLRMARQGLQLQLEAVQATSEAAASAPLGRYASCEASVLLLDALQITTAFLACNQHDLLMLWSFSPLPELAASFPRDALVSIQWHVEAAIATL